MKENDSTHFCVLFLFIELNLFKAPLHKAGCFFIPIFKEAIQIKGETYEEFVEKFKPKRTTDDCYTPPEIYKVVKNRACDEYNIKNLIIQAEKL